MFDIWYIYIENSDLLIEKAPWKREENSIDSDIYQAVANLLTEKRPVDCAFNYFPRGLLPVFIEEMKIIKIFINCRSSRDRN